MPDALDAPRWCISEGLDVSFEPGLDESVYAALRALDHDLSITAAPGASHGRGQAVYVLDHGYLAASDMRCDGQAVGF